MNTTRSHLLDDPYLEPYREIIQRRAARAEERAAALAQGPGSLAEFACAHEYYGLHKRGSGVQGSRGQEDQGLRGQGTTALDSLRQPSTAIETLTPEPLNPLTPDPVTPEPLNPLTPPLTPSHWVFREWAPHATAVWLIGDFSNWMKEDRFLLRRLERGVWEIEMPLDWLRHGQHYRLEVAWDGGCGERIPAYARRVVQSEETQLFAAQVWDPPEPYVWQMPGFRAPPRVPLIYEAHIGMAQEREGVGTYDEFRTRILPRIAKAGYNTLQLMAVMEHPYYGSFGYHVSSFFACSSRFGTPEELKALVDAAHGLGIAVIMDIVHSHAVKNERDGLSLFDGTPYQYFHDGLRGWHEAWDSRCFDYTKTDVLHFLLSNCRYWLDEFRFDGFRFDGITSMLYLHHGLGVDFMDYAQYFDPTVDEDAWVYCNLANRVIHEIRPDALTIAEDVSGMPGLAAPVSDLGAGFDYRMAMGVPECWFKLVRDIRDEDWNIGYLWHELTNRRADEQTVNYVESHDQALVGGKTFFFQLVDAAIYDAMSRATANLQTERGIALHKLARLATLATAGHAYLNFMGNEFGHPEWIDFPREGNGFSYHYARRQWSLRDDPSLLYWCLAEFDEAMMRLFSLAETQRCKDAEDEQENKNLCASASLRLCEKKNNTCALQGTQPRRLLISDSRKILVFERGALVFLFNFHSSESVVDFPVIVPPGASYRIALNTDDERFGGQGRIRNDQVFALLPETRNNEIVHTIKVYLPCRTALALTRCTVDGNEKR